MNIQFFAKKILGAFLRIHLFESLYLQLASLLKLASPLLSIFIYIEELEKQSSNFIANKCTLINEMHLCMFSTTIFWNNFFVLLGYFYASLGIKVDLYLILHPNLLSSRKPNIGYRHWSSMLGLYHNSKLCCGNLLIQDLALLPYSNDANDFEDVINRIAHDTALIDTSYLLRKLDVDISMEPYKSQFNLRRDQLLSTLSCIIHPLRSIGYTRIIIPNGTVLDFGAVFKLSSYLNIPVSTIELWDRKNCVVISDKKAVTCIPTNQQWIEYLNNHSMIDLARKGYSLIISRSLPSYRELVFKYQTKKAISALKVNCRLKLDSTLPTILICPNVPFDSIYYTDNLPFFRNMNEWLVLTIKYLLIHRVRANIMLKPHPAEVALTSANGCIDLLKANFSDNEISRITIANNINTYSLINVADFGICFASTTAIEMAALATPVIVGQPEQHFANKGFTIDSETIAQYFENIDNLLGGFSPSLDTNYPDLARAYAFFFFNKWPIYSPWASTNINICLHNMSLLQMLRNSLAHPSCCPYFRLVPEISEFNKRDAN